MFRTLIALIFSIVIFIGIMLGVYFAVKALIKYYANWKNKKTRQQEELDKMNIDDL